MKEVITVKRRRFMVKAGGTLLAAGAAAVVDAPRVIAQPKVQWRMSTGWTAALDVVQGAAERMGQIVEEMSGGRFKIEVFPGGQIMPPFECFDAASKGTIEAFMATSAYWYEKEPAICGATTGDGRGTRLNGAYVSSQSWSPSPW